MISDFEKKYHSYEQREWWFKARRDMLKRLIPTVCAQKLLDVGCAGGVLLQELADYGFEIGNLYGVDISDAAITLCQQRGLVNTFVMDGANLDFRDDFDILVASDCLEHIEDDCQALKSWHKRLKTGGKLIVFVPAFSFLWSKHDEVNQHYRRYTKQELVRKVEQSGFRVARSGYWNVALFWPILSIRITKRLLRNLRSSEPPDDLQETHPVVNKVLESLLKIENSLIERKINFPFGVSTFCVAIK